MNSYIKSSLQSFDLSYVSYIAFNVSRSKGSNSIYVGNKSEKICFNSMSGPLIARRNGEMITLDFPLNSAQKMVIDFFMFLLSCRDCFSKQE